MCDAKIKFAFIKQEIQSIKNIYFFNTYEKRFGKNILKISTIREGAVVNNELIKNKLKLWSRLPTSTYLSSLINHHDRDCRIFIDCNV